MTPNMRHGEFLGLRPGVPILSARQKFECNSGKSTTVLYKKLDRGTSRR